LRVVFYPQHMSRLLHPYKLGFAVLLALMVSCATYHDKTISTERALLAGDYKDAQEIIDKNKFLTKRRNMLLYFMEAGRLNNLRSEFEASNTNLNYADDLMNDYRNLFEMAIGVTVNAAMQPYKAAPHEKVLVHYYKALNYLQLGNVEEAIVEARRLDLVSAQNLADANNKEKKYGLDPFGLIIMGLLYEVDNDYNNAFIAYRNAREVYLNDETGLFKGKMPSHLEADISRMAAYSRIAYENAVPFDNKTNGEAIIFWENGLAPFKEERNMFFSLNQKNGNYFFVSGDVIIPVDYNFNEEDEDFKPSDIGLIRVATSYYVPRAIPNQQLKLRVNGENQKMELLADVTANALQYERDIYFKELGKALVRLAVKKISELALAEKNEYAGAALGLANVISEQADTRSWQTLPAQIQFSRIPLNEGENTVELTMSDGTKFTYKFEGDGRMHFRNLVTF
jgi:hypothetical protein